jgi:hypothetical protein
MKKMNKKSRSIFITGVVALSGLLLLCNILPQVKATGLNDSDTQRITYIEVSYTTYEWWLLSWQNSQVVCQVYV